MYGTFNRVDDGGWIEYPDSGTGLRAFTENVSDGPVTVVWNGCTDFEDLREFIQSAVIELSDLHLQTELIESYFPENVPLLSSQLARYRTWALSAGGAKNKASAGQPVLPESDFPPSFIRVECVIDDTVSPPSRRAIDFTEIDTANADIIAWANIADPHKRNHVQIGVYCKRELLPQLSHEIARFVSSTSNTSPFPAEEVLSELVEDLESISPDLSLGI